MMATLTKNGNSACAALRDKKSTISLKAPFRHYYSYSILSQKHRLFLFLTHDNIVRERRHL